jgi:capsule polysaccharide export protein KpsE/RkpR
MPGDYFWHCVEALSVALDGDRETVEENLNLYERHSLAFPPEKRAEVRLQLIRIIGGLARLETRLAEVETKAARSAANKLS